MDLLEYQAKELFHEVGIPILPSQPIHDPGELKRLNIPYPVVLKSQVRAGGRGRAGGIRFVENTIDAIAAARSIFHLPILGEYPEVLLAEARYDTQEEFFLGVVLDYQIQRPVLLGSVKGGMDVEALLKQMQKVVIDDEFHPFHARRLVKKMGIKEGLVAAVSAIVEKMYHLFLLKDLDLIEINPLGVSSSGEVMALDGKITANDHGMKRHPDLIELMSLKKHPLEEETDNTSSVKADLHWLQGVDKNASVALVCNTMGLALSTWDLIAMEKVSPACCLILQEDNPNVSLEEQMAIGLEKILELSGLKVVLINILSNSETSTRVAQACGDYFQPQLKQQLAQKGEERMPRETGGGTSARKRTGKVPVSSSPSPQLSWVIRLAGGEIDSLKENLSSLPLHWTESLETAIKQTISLAKVK